MGNRDFEAMKVRVRLMSLPPSTVADGRLLVRRGAPDSDDEPDEVWSFRSRPLLSIYGLISFLRWDDCVFDRLLFRLSPEEAAFQCSFPALERRMAVVTFGDLPDEAIVAGRALDRSETGQERETLLFSGCLAGVRQCLRETGYFDAIQLSSLVI